MTTKHLTVFLLFIWICSACQQEKTAGNPDFIEVNVVKTYPVKELYLEDLAEIEYVLPELHNDFLYRGIPRLITDDYLFFREEELLVFDRKGKPLHKMNRRGEGPEEFIYVFGILYDPEVDELYISTVEKIQVYSVTGEYKRSIPLKEGAFISNMHIFDEKHLICYDNYEYYSAPFFLLSREDGRITEEIDIRYETKLQMFSQRTEGEMVYTYTGPQEHIVKAKDGFLLTEHSIDTVYLYTFGKELIPVLTRTPPIATQQPYIYLNSYQESPDYLFMTTINAEFSWETTEGFFPTNLLIDKKDGKIYEQKIKLKDYAGKEIALSPGLPDRVTGFMTGMFFLSADELLEALEAGKLSGRLQEITSQMEEESNMLLLLYQFK